MSTLQPTTTAEPRPLNEGDKWWARTVTPLLARLRREYPECFTPPPPVAEPGRQVEAESEAA